MGTTIWGVSFFLIISKFLDCLSTSIRIGSVEHEQNRFARKTMELLGIQTTIWLVFLLSILIVVVSTFYVLNRYSLLFSLSFIVLGIFIGIVQLAVARNNYFRKQNLITKFLFRLLQKMPL